MNDILLVGYGTSGISIYNFLIKKGVSVVVFDDDINKYVPNRVVNVNWNNISYVVKSPSIHIMPHNRHKIIDEAILHNKPVYSAFDIFKMEHSNARIIGITATNGKSTTTQLVYEILKNANYSVQIGGNIGVPYMDLPTSDYYVFEMSSYELTSSRLLDFYIGAVLNIEPDHLDFHGSFENYIDAKHKLLYNSKFRIVSKEDTYSINSFPRNSNNIVITIGNDTNVDYYTQENLLIDNNVPVLDFSNLNNLLGKHNRQNILCAYAIGKLLGINTENIVNSIIGFKPLPHRMNIVRKIKNVLFVNDSKATNPSSAAKALETFVGYSIYWLVGGRSKKVNPLPYIEQYLSNVEKIYLFGESELEFNDIFHGVAKLEICHTLKHTITSAYKDALSSEVTSVVLLSPMCASFDQFTSFSHRGSAFVNTVNAL